MPREKKEPWKTLEHHRAIITMREMIAVCADAYQPDKCAKCALFLGKSCPARRYLATCTEPDAWDIR